MIDLLKIDQALEDSNILLKGVTKTIKNETKRKISKHFIGCFRSQFVRNLLAGKGTVRASSWNKKGKGTVRAGYRKE